MSARDTSTDASRLPVGETPCPSSPDEMHCSCWYDDIGPCCRCGDDTDAGLSDASPGRAPGERMAP
jgi:hypothetical protein